MYLRSCILIHDDLSATASKAHIYAMLETQKRELGNVLNSPSCTMPHDDTGSLFDRSSATTHHESQQKHKAL
eukprot:5836574-Amphidinium_carterae.2